MWTAQYFALVIWSVILPMLFISSTVAADQMTPQIMYEIGLFPSEKDVIKVGASTSLTKSDRYGYGGTMLANGWDMFTNWLNVVRKGILINGTTYSFQMSYVEDYSDSLYVSYVYDQLLEDVDFYFGPFSSGLTSSAVRITEPNSKLLISAYASNTTLFADTAFTFGTTPPQNYYHEAAFETFSELGAASIAILRDADYPQCHNETASAEYAKIHGIELFGHYTVDPRSGTYSEDVMDILTILKSNHVETVYACSYLDLCIEIVKSSRVIDYNPHGLMLAQCLDEPDFYSAVGQDAVYMLMPTPWVSSLNITDAYTGWTPKQFSELFNSFYGAYPPFYAAGAFSNGLILMDAIEKVQTLDAARISEFIKRSSFPTVYGNVTFNQKNQYSGDFLIVQVQTETLTYDMVLPTPAPNVTLVYPAPSWVVKDCQTSTKDCSGHGTCSINGTCICDAQYYSSTGSGSCETFCDGLSQVDRDDNLETGAVIRLACELVNNKTDGWFDREMLQVTFVPNIMSITCSEQAGSIAVRELESWAYSLYGGDLCGMVGAYCSTASMGVASYGNIISLPQISYGSTAVELSNKNDYAFFARTCLPDNVQGYCLSDMLYDLRLYSIAVVSTDDSYASSLSNVFQDSYGERNGTILKHIHYEVLPNLNSSFYFDIMNELAATGAPTIVLVAVRSEVRKILDARSVHPIMRRDDYVWVGVDDWVGTSDFISPLGTIGLVPKVLETGTSGLGKQFLELWGSLDSAIYPDADGDRSTISTYSSYAVDAIFAMALGYQSVLESNFAGTDAEFNQQMYSSLINSVNFVGVSGKVDFDASGNRMYAQYDIMNVHTLSRNGWKQVGLTDFTGAASYASFVNKSEMTWPDGSVGMSSASRYSNQYVPFCPAGFEPVYSQSVSIYSCNACPVGKYKAYPGSEMCKECPEGAQCDNVAVTVPCVQKGYWRPIPPSNALGDFDKYEIFLCDVEERCKGGCELNNTCSANVKQTSPVCGVCEDGFYPIGRAECAKCPADVAFLSSMEVFFILSTIFLGFAGLFTLHAQHACKEFKIPLKTILGGSVVEQNPKLLTSKASDDGPPSDVSDSKARANKKRRRSIAASVRLGTMSFIRTVKSSGLFVTVKLTMSFVQVLLGSLSSIDVNWGDSVSSFVQSIEYSPFQSIPLFTGCRQDRDGSYQQLETVYLTTILILIVPVGFVLFAIFINRLVLHLMMKRHSDKLNRDQVSKSLQDITIKSFVWFSLISFPILASSTLGYYNCRDMNYLGSFLRNDYSISCEDSETYKGFLILAIINTLLYPIGIPLLFYFLIRSRKQSWAIVPSSPLHYNFNPSWAYYEVFELFRKLLLTSIVSFVLPGTASQCLYLFIVDIIALLALAICRPYNADSDDFLSAMLISIECIIFLVAFLLVSEVYVVDNYDKSSMMSSVLAMLIIGFCVLVPLNVTAKIPSLEEKLERQTKKVKDFIRKIGISLPSFSELDARKRYQREAAELRESMVEMRESISRSSLHGHRLSGDSTMGVSEEREKNSSVATSNGTNTTTTN